MKRVQSLFALATALAAASAQAQTFIRTHHTDLNIHWTVGTDPAPGATVRMGDTFHIFPRDVDLGGVEYDVSLSTGPAVLYADDSSSTTVPAGYPYIGAPVGSSFYLLPQRQKTSLLYLGYSGYDVPTATTQYYDVTTESKGRVPGTDQWVRVGLYAVYGPGAFSVFQNDSSSSVPFMSTYDDGVSNPNSRGLDSTDGLSVDDALWIPANGHIHYNWGFTLPGAYDVDLQPSLYYNGLLSVGTPQRIHFLVANTPVLWLTTTLGNFVGDGNAIPITVTLRTPGTTTVVATKTATLGGDGIVTLAAPVVGTYDVSVKASHWLRRTVKGISFASGVATDVSVSLVNGDVNGDNRVNNTDASLLQAALNSRRGDARYSALADLNGDGRVNNTDSSILLANLNLRGDN